jgi:hypothetical protein
MSVRVRAAVRSHVRARCLLQRAIGGARLCQECVMVCGGARMLSGAASGVAACAAVSVTASGNTERPEFASAWQTTHCACSCVTLACAISDVAESDCSYTAAVNGAQAWTWVWIANACRKTANSAASRVAGRWAVRDRTPLLRLPVITPARYSVTGAPDNPVRLDCDQQRRIAAERRRAGAQVGGSHREPWFTAG